MYFSILFNIIMWLWTIRKDNVEIRIGESIFSLYFIYIIYYVLDSFQINNKRYNLWVQNMKYIIL